MAQLILLVVLCASLGSSFGFILEQRQVTEVLTVGNGGSFGGWGPAQFCPMGQYAVGYDMKVEPYLGSRDDTALNGIRLVCSDGASVTSTVGGYGSWQGHVACRQHHSYLTAFSLQVESYQGSHHDDTAANWVKFQCRDMHENRNNGELNISPGFGSFGTFGGWSDHCSLHSAICGLRTRVESYQGGGDDTELNDVVFYCCSADLNRPSIVG